MIINTWQKKWMNGHIVIGSWQTKEQNLKKLMWHEAKNKLFTINLKHYENTRI